MMIALNRYFVQGLTKGCAEAPLASLGELPGTSPKQGQHLRELYDRPVAADESVSVGRVADHIEPRRPRRARARAAVLDRDDRGGRKRKAAGRLPIRFRIRLAGGHVVEADRERHRPAYAERVEIGVDDRAA